MLNTQPHFLNFFTFLYKILLQDEEHSFKILTKIKKKA